MVKTQTLKSGIRLIVEDKRGVEGVSFRMLFTTGSYNETPEIFGISHLIEHMLFKGTKKRSAYDIVNDLEKAGASVNAFTDKEQTCYYTYSTRDALETCVEVLSDMFFNSTFNETELKREKKVVIEEMNMYNDRPQDVVDTINFETFFESTPYAHDVIGNKNTVNSITREQILNYIKTHYTPKNLIVSFAGKIDFDSAKNLVEKYIESNFKIKEKPEFIKTDAIFIPKRNQVKKYMKTNQSHVIIAYPVENLYHSNDVLKLLTFSLCYNMSSRLFQEIREKLGLVYSIYSSYNKYKVGGMFYIQFATATKNVPLALKTIKKELNKVVKDGFTKEELKSSKTSIIAQIKLSNDNVQTLSAKNINNLINFNQIISKQEQIKNTKKVTLNQLNDYAQKLFSQENYVVSMVGDNTKLNLLSHFKD